MTQFTSYEIARLRELAAKATPRPWEYDLEGEFVQGDGHHLAQTWNKQEEDFYNALANGTYIAAAANAMPAALDEIDRLKAEIDAMQHAYFLYEEPQPDGKLRAPIGKLLAAKDAELAAKQAIIDEQAAELDELRATCTELADMAELAGDWLRLYEWGAK